MVELDACVARMDAGCEAALDTLRDHAYNELSLLG
jgi:hypothetical protein